MQPDRIIYFGVDKDSFKRGRVPRDVTKRIISAADGIAQLIRSKNLGIKFEFRPDSASNIFNIRYDSNLGLDTLARAFFPSDSRKTWQLRISKSLALSKTGKSGYLDYIPNILAQEFAHILGLRHWNAGFDPAELREPSVLWPETIERSRISVMNTGVHPNHMRFSEELTFGSSARSIHLPTETSMPDARLSMLTRTLCLISCDWPSVGLFFIVPNCHICSSTDTQREKRKRKTWLDIVFSISIY